MDVLLVVDMQKALFKTPRFNAHTVVFRLGAQINFNLAEHQRVT